MAENPFDRFDDGASVPIDEASGLPADNHVPDSRLPVVPTGSDQALDHAPFTKDADGNLTFYNASGAVIGRKPVNGPMEVDVSAGGAPSAEPPSSNPFDRFDDKPVALTEPDTTLAGLEGSATRGLAPIAAGTALGAGAGALLGGVGAVPGALAGAAAAGLTEAVGDPAVAGINKLFGTNYTQPSEAFQHLLTSIGVSEPRSSAEQLVYQMAHGGGAGAATAGLGAALAPVGGRQLKVLYSYIKHSPQAVAGFHRALGDYIAQAGEGNNFTAAGDRIPSINKMRQAIAQVVNRAGNTLTTQQKIVLKSVNRELERANFAATAAKPAGSETELNRTFKGAIDFVPGMGLAKNVLSRVIDAMDNSLDVKRLLTQAILDPEFAAILLKRQTPHHLSQASRVLASARSAAIISGATAVHPAPLADTILNRIQAMPAHTSVSAAAQEQSNAQ